MTYRRRRGLGGGRGGSARGSPTGGPPKETPHDRDETESPSALTGSAAEPVDSPEHEPGSEAPAAAGQAPGTAAEASEPRVSTLSELFSVPEGTDPTARSRRRRTLRWLVSIVAVGVFFAAGYLAAEQWVLPEGRSAADPTLIQVPELVGLTEAEAQGRLERLDLEYTVRSEVTHHLAPIGAVLAQDPLPGQYARPGAPVYVSLSRGPETHVLPDVGGMSERQATIVLERLGYSVVLERRTHTLERNRAITTVPEAGTELAVPAEVRLVVSGGRPVIQVPDLVGMHVDDAAEALSGAGLELGAITYDPQAIDAPGRIVGQYPPPGYSMREGDRIEVRVAGDVERVEPTRQWFERNRPNE